MTKKINKDLTTEQKLVLFEDGPNPTGKRYCNNGVCLTFKPKV